MLCILTGQQERSMPFAVQNKFFSVKTSFPIFFHHEWKKRRESAKMLVDTQKLVDSWGKCEVS